MCLCNVDFLVQDESLMHIATTKRRKEIMQILIGAKADVNIRNANVRR